MLLSLDEKGPLYVQVYRALRHAILSGELEPGARLPATRAVAKELGVSRNVVLLAYDQLMAEGYAAGRVGAGTFVAATLPEVMLRAPSPSSTARSPWTSNVRLSRYGCEAVNQWSLSGHGPNRDKLRYDFRYGAVVQGGDGLRQWNRLRNRYSTQSDLSYSSAEGHPALRTAIARYVRRARAVVCEPEQVLIVNGSQQALDLTGRILLEPGHEVLIEEPHYRGARHAFLAAGAQLVPCPVDDDGLRLDAAAARNADARLAYVTPSHQFPTGAVMSLGRRLALLEWAERGDAFILEDDYDSEYRYEGRPVEAVQGLDQSGRTIYMGTYSNLIFPALRLGFLVVPAALVEPFIAAKWLADRHTPILDQLVMADFISEGHFERHLRRTRTQNAERRAALLDALRSHLGDSIRVTGTNAGIHLVVWLDDLRRNSTEALIAQAAAADVGVYSVAPLYLKPPREAGLLMGYASLTPDEIDEGVRRLTTVIESVRRAMKGGKKPPRRRRRAGDPAPSSHA